MQNKKYVSFLAVAGILASLVIAAPAFAQTNQGFGRGMAGRGGQTQRPGVVGKVSSVSGNTITVTSVVGPNGGTATIYTIDATNAKITKNNIAGTISSISAGDTIVVQGTVSGTNVTATNIRDGVMTPGARGAMGISGTVATINGTTLTVTGKARPNGAVVPTYTVDASSATVTINGASSSVSNIKVGDNVMVQGTVSGTSVTAKTIRDGVAQLAIQGNGQPVVAGKVAAINGSSITITNSSSVTYIIDATNAKILVGNQASSISNVAVGDNVVVQGTVNGTSIVASSVIDQKGPKGYPINNNPSDNNKKPQAGFMGGIMGGITNFFKHLFGF